jgi:hypothetical protein
MRPEDKGVIARFTPEQTARFFAGEELGRPAWTDPETQRKQDRQRELLRGALKISIDHLAKALGELSPQTEARLLDLGSRALAGDPEAVRLFVAMYSELVHQALV